MVISIGERPSFKGSKALGESHDNSSTFGRLLSPRCLPIAIQEGHPRHIAEQPQKKQLQKKQLRKQRELRLRMETQARIVTP